MLLQNQRVWGYSSYIRGTIWAAVYTTIDQAPPNTVVYFPELARMKTPFIIHLKASSQQGFNAVTRPVVVPRIPLPQENKTAISWALSVAVRFFVFSE